jgi:hypothetical protein
LRSPGLRNTSCPSFEALEGFLGQLNIVEFDDHVAFVKAWIDGTLERRPNLSQRAIALSLKWAPSMLNDILHRRKPLSLRRALELAQYLGMTATETEHLVWLVLRDSGESGLSRFASNLCSSKRRSIPVYAKAKDDPSGPSLADSNVMAVYALYRWQRRIMPFVEAAPHLRTTGVQTKKTYEALVDRLRRAGLIDFEGAPESKGDHPALMRKATPSTPADEQYGFAIQTGFVRNTLRFFKRPFGKNQYAVASRYVLLAPEDLNEAKEILRQAGSRIGALSVKNLACSPGKSDLFQCDLNLFPMRDAERPCYSLPAKRPDEIADRV